MTGNHTEDRAVPDSEMRAAIATTEHWCPSEGEEQIFGTRTRADELIGVAYLRARQLTGKGVNVAIVDQGLNAESLGANYGGGWAVGEIEPGRSPLEPSKPHGGHGMLVAANVLSVAPDAKLYDLPMVPSTRISDIPEFFEGTANKAFEQMLDGIADFRKKGIGPWVIVNAWAIYDRTSEDEKYNYTNNPDHKFNRLIDRAVDEVHDVVFGAGNCGEFCPDQRCGLLDRGPGRSIFGANCHPKVMTVGAVRSDKIWLGYSSQGPGQPNMAQEKPDLCAPSNFVETTNAATANGGTSTACALVAGVIAALRGTWNADKVSPARLKQVLNETATKISDGWSDRTGNGILNARDAFDKLAAPTRTAAS